MSCITGRGAIPGRSRLSGGWVMGDGGWVMTGIGDWGLDEAIGNGQ